VVGASHLRFQGLRCGSGIRIQGSGFVLGFRVSGFGPRRFGLRGSDLGVWGLGFGVWGSGSGVSGFRGWGALMMRRPWVSVIPTAALYCRLPPYLTPSFGIRDSGFEFRVSCFGFGGLVVSSALMMSPYAANCLHMLPNSTLCRQLPPYLSYNRFRDFETSGFGVSGFRVPDFGVSEFRSFGFRVPGFGFQFAVFRVSIFSFQISVLGFGFRGFGVSGFGFRVLGFSFRGFGFRVSGFGFGVSVPVSGFQVWGFELRISVSGFSGLGFGV